MVNLYSDNARMWPLRYTRQDPVKLSKNCRENAGAGNHIPGRLYAPK